MPAVAAWSHWVRTTHWLVAAAVLLDLCNDTGVWHRAIGYAGLVAMALRIVHGFASRQPASHLWWPSVGDIRHHLGSLARRSGDERPGHNPLGQLAVYAMWALIALLGLSGWLSRTDALWGEEWPVAWHVLCADALLGLVVLHLLAVAGLSFWQRRSLVRAMLPWAD